MQEVIRYKDAPLGIPNEIPLAIMSRKLKKILLLFYPAKAPMNCLVVMDVYSDRLSIMKTAIKTVPCHSTNILLTNMNMSLVGFATNI